MAEPEVYQRLRNAEVEVGKLPTRVAASERAATAAERRLEAMSTQLTRIEGCPPHANTYHPAFAEQPT